MGTKTQEKETMRYELNVETLVPNCCCTEPARRVTVFRAYGLFSHDITNDHDYLITFSCSFIRETHKHTPYSSTHNALPLSHALRCEVQLTRRSHTTRHQA